MVKILVLGAILLALSPASATPETVPDSETLTTSDHSAGTAFEWVVPEGVTSITVTATGGNGGTASDARPGGRGAVVTVELAVQAGAELVITLGADGSLTTGGAGYGAGGTGIAAGGGGGSTAITIDGTVSIVAGAGGGSSDASSAGGGGAGGVPLGQPGTRRGGAGGGDGIGGFGVAPWGGPGGASFGGGGGTVLGTESGSGGGAGYGGGGAGGARGDGGGGGSYSATEGATYANRLDDLADGWVQLDFVRTVAEPTASPTDSSPAGPSTAKPDYSGIGMAAAAIVVLGIGSLIVWRRVRK
jgi:hypothetical protein